MHLLDRSVILPEEIDNLGHLNVRFYLIRAYRANQELLSRLGFSREARRAAGTVLGRNESYTRFHREQHLGATLDVVGGVLEMGPTTIRTGYEIRNSETGEVAAAIVSEFELEDGASRAALPWPAEVRRRADAFACPLSAHATPRSLTFERPNLAVTCDEVLERVGEQGDGAMGILSERTITAEDCDAFGFLSEGGDLMAGARRAQDLPNSAFGPPIERNNQGVRFGWAVLESRTVQLGRPRQGDVLRSIGAVVGIHRKARHTRRWTFDSATGAVIATDDTVTVALDLDGRRAIEIPADLRELLAARHAPEFA